MQLLLAGLAAGAPSWAARTQARASQSLRRPCLSASQIARFADSLKAHDNRDAYPAAFHLAFGDVPKDVAAFEENGTFIYAAGMAAWPGGGVGHRMQSHLLRRWIVLKPSIIILDDEVLGAGPEGAVPPCLDSRSAPQIAGNSFRIPGLHLSGKVLLPRRAVLRVRRLAAPGPANRLEWTPQPGGESTRFVCVLSAGGNRASVRSQLTRRGGLARLMVAAGSKVFHLELPPLNHAAGRIEVASLQGKTLLSLRPFPSGILPHGPEGSDLLEQWDRDYQGPNPPPWDIRKPAHALQEVVASGAVRPGRAVDLCCGSGTDAIYLARHGFEVTGIDIAPTALSQALQKAKSAGVAVDWLLADVLALPDLKPFDFIYDRGCYHVVRDQNLEAYLDTLRRISHPGTQMLLLAARRNASQGSGSPLGVTEDELRFDFLPLFQIEKLQAIRLESNEPGPGPLGWSVLMRRKAQP